MKKKKHFLGKEGGGNWDEESNDLHVYKSDIWSIYIFQLLHQNKQALGILAM